MKTYFFLEGYKQKSQKVSLNSLMWRNPKDFSTLVKSRDFTRGVRL